MEILSPSFIKCSSAAWPSWWSTFSNIHIPAETCIFCLLLYQIPLLRRVGSIVLVVYLQISLAAIEGLFSLFFTKLNHLSLKLMCSWSLNDDTFLIAIFWTVSSFSTSFLKNKADTNKILQLQPPQCEVWGNNNLLWCILHTPSNVAQFTLFVMIAFHSYSACNPL